MLFSESFLNMSPKIMLPENRPTTSLKATGKNAPGRVLKRYVVEKM